MSVIMHHGRFTAASLTDFLLIYVPLCPDIVTPCPIFIMIGSFYHILLVFPSSKFKNVVILTNDHSMQGNILLRNTYKKCPIKINYFSGNHLGVIWTYKDSFIRSTQFFCSVPSLTAFSSKSTDSSGRKITILTPAPTVRTIVGCLTNFPGYLPARLK